MNQKTVYRGSNKKFGLSIENALWKALYFTHDYDFASKFGDVKKYKIKPNKILNLTIGEIRDKAFKKMAEGYTDSNKLEQIYKNGIHRRFKFFKPCQFDTRRRN